jgi:hypothetical protein
MRIRTGGAAHLVVAELSALCIEVLVLENQMSPATIRKVLAYIRQRAVGMDWRGCFWKHLFGAVELQWLQCK